MADLITRISLGPLVHLPTNYNNPTLTTSTKATLCYTSVTSGAFARVTIVNGSTTATVAWTFIALGGSNPNITADYNATTGGIAIPPGGSTTFSIPAQYDLYVAASASAPVNVASFLYRV